MRYKRLLVTGCGGMLGEAVYQYVKSHKIKAFLSDLIPLDDWLNLLDVRDIDAVEAAVVKFKPDIIFHLAALTDLELCELDKENAMRTNAIGTENVALVAKKYNIVVVYISTAGVFDGEKDNYFDLDIPNPINIYGLSKYRGELACQSLLNKYFIFRAGWMMGGGVLKDKKFINKIYKQIKSGKKDLFIVNDKFGTPTYTYDFIDSIFKVIETDWYGLYNQVCLGDTSRFEIAEALVENLGVKDEITFHEVSSDYFKDKYFVPRPPSERLINQKLISRNICFMRDWKLCLEEYSKVFRGDLEGVGKERI